jgi:hypothetical protein
MHVYRGFGNEFALIQCRCVSPRERPRCRRVINVMMEVGERGFGGIDWIGLALDRDKWWALVKAVMNLRVP